MQDRLSPREVGELVGEATGGPPVSKDSVCRWVRTGKLTGVRVAGRVFVDLAALAEFFRANNSTDVLRPIADRLRAAGRDPLAEKLLAEDANHAA